MQRRIISTYDNDPVEDDEENADKMDIDQAPPPPSFRSNKDKKKRIDSTEKTKTSSLLSFDDEGEFFE